MGLLGRVVGREERNCETYEVLVEQGVEVVEFSVWVPEAGLDRRAVGFQGGGDGGEVDDTGVL